MEPFAAPHPDSVVIPDVPRKSRRAMLVAVGLVTVVAVGAGVFALAATDDEPTYSLTEAASTADEVKTIAFTMVMDSLGVEMSAEAEVEIKKQLTHITMDLSNGAIGVGGELEIIVDAENKVAYMNTEFFKGLGIPVEADWLLMDEEFLSRSSDQALFSGEAVSSPLDLGDLIDSANKVEELGFDEVNGEKVKHYRVTVTGEAVLRANPQFAEQLPQVDGVLPDEVVYEIYVNEDNRILRSNFVMDIGPGEISVDLVVKSINKSVDIEIPDEDDVTDAGEFL
ncbi:MAG: hypothetical protein HY826_14550 [Actinobacteria bacterium]|nr:hypothetical protein [Actinomycetota bacterium]